jgi:Mrp family chromosome partitioning ATPase
MEFMMKKIAVLALKGGVGKSTVVAGLSLALVERGLKVGCVDLDVTGSNLYSALGLEHSPKWELDNIHEKLIVPRADGYWLLSIASFVGEENAVMWDGSQNTELDEVIKEIHSLQQKSTNSGLGTNVPELEHIRRQIDDVMASSKWRYVKELLSEDIVTWPESLDYQVFDLPPSSSQEMFSFLDQTNDLFGVFIVSQPSSIAATGLVRTIDLLRVKQIPIIGLVVNQDGFLNKHNEIEYQFLSSRVDLREISKKSGIPFLISIPQSGNVENIKPYFSELAGKIIESTPVVLKDVTLKKKFKRKVTKGIARRV